MSGEGKSLLGDASGEEDQKRKVKVWKKFMDYVEGRGLDGISPEVLVSYIAKRVYSDRARYDVVAGEKSAIVMVVMWC